RIAGLASSEMALMRGMLRPSRIGGAGAACCRLARAVACCFALVVSLAAIVSTAHAQSPTPVLSASPLPSPTPVPSPTQINSDISTGSQVLNLGSNFLERLGNQATNGFLRGARTNPAGGGASEAAAEGPLYRTWGELYGLSMTTGPQGDYV